MSRIFFAPSKYVQGAGAIHSVGQYAAGLGTKALIIGGKTSLSLCGGPIADSLKEKKRRRRPGTFSG